MMAAALRHGATQFKVNFDQLRKVIHESEWATKKHLIAVAAEAGDGTSGVRQAAGPTVTPGNREIRAINIFEQPRSSENFGSASGPANGRELRARYDGASHVSTQRPHDQHRRTAGG